MNHTLQKAEEERRKMLEKTAEEERRKYRRLPTYYKYPDCFHCVYGECGWTGVPRKDENQELIRAFSMIEY